MSQVEDRKAEQLAQDYSAMGDSVVLITATIAAEADEDSQGTVERNVQHLELMVAKDDWGDEDMTAVSAAISSGNEYIS